MATFYLDLEGGNDSNDGTTFANRWRTFVSGATAARVAPGDTIRVMGSKTPTSLSQSAQWTSAKTDRNGTSITSSTNASPIVITKASHGLSNGDTVCINSHSTNTNANGTWTVANVSTNTFELASSTGNGTGGATGTYKLRTSNVVTLTTAVTQSIASTASGGRTAWTASGSVTATINTSDYKCGYGSDSIAAAAGFTTGKAAYFATGTLDLSGYRQVSFWIKQTSGTLAAASAISLKLCSDAAGATPVDTINIPSLGATGVWRQVTVDTGGALGSAIASVGFYINSDVGAQTFLLSNIIACKDSTSADSLTLSSLIGKNDGQWWGIQSIDGTRVMLDLIAATQPNATVGYYGTTESVTTYKREPMQIGNPASSSGTLVNATADSGTSGSPLVFSGGWNRTDMSTQDGMTWLDGRNGNGLFMSVAEVAFNTLEKFGAVRYTTGFDVSGESPNTSLVDCSAVCCSGGVTVSSASARFSLTNGIFLSISTVGTISSNWVLLDNVAVLSTSSGGITLNSSGSKVTAFSGHNCGAAPLTTNAIIVAEDVYLYDNAGIALACVRGGVWTGVDLRRNATGLNISTNKKCLLYGSSDSNTTLVSTFDDATLANWTSTSDTTLVNNNTGNGGLAFFDRFADTDDDHRVYGESVIIQTDASVRHTAADVAWKCVISSATARPSTYPVILPLGKYRVVDGALATVTLWVRRDHTSAFVALLCKGGQLPGVGTPISDVSSIITAAINTWEQLTITFTPTQAGMVELSASFWATAASQTTWIDDLEFSQSGSTSITNGLNVVSEGRIQNPGGSGSSSGGVRMVNTRGGADQ